MYRKEVNAHSPLRILERSAHGGLGAGNVGVVMARAGVGKTAFLVQIGLDDLMRERDVLHIAVGSSLEHVQSWYDSLFDDLAKDMKLENRDEVAAKVARRRVIQAYSASEFSVEKVDKAAEMYVKHLGIQPKAILVDGYGWNAGSVVKVAAELGALRALARRLGAELWLSAQTHREVVTQQSEQIPDPALSVQELIDVAIYLEPREQLVTVRLLKDHGVTDIPDMHLELEPDTMKLVTEASPDKTKLPPHAHTLLSGGAKGAEASFGSKAEAWGLQELNFSFAGRRPERTRGIVELDEVALKQGQVSSSYIEAQLHRKFPKTPQFRKMLHTIWHQVVTSGQVFVIGQILEDGTVKGGTGWAAELARHFGKPVHVYDQEQQVWKSWDGQAWVEEEAPCITRSRFTGTGTRELNAAGEAAIEALYTHSFGPIPE